MRYCITSPTVSLTILALATCLSVLATAQEPVSLFNGKDLTGWVLVNTPPQTWKVEDGMLVCTGKPIGELRTEKMYQNFEFEVEWRHMVSGGNAGIFVWADDITARGVPFHRSIEVQVLDHGYGNSKSHTTHGDIFPIHGAKMTPFNGRGGDRAFPTEERSKPSPEWNHYRIVCNDGTISLSVNGKVVTKGKEASPRKGYICLESEGGVVHYRNLRIKELPPTKIDEADIAISNRGYKSIYTGLDLSGWKSSESAKSAWQANDWVLTFDGAVTQADAKLESTESRELNGFVLDFKFKDKSQGLTVQLGDSAALKIAATNDPQFASLLQKNGGWNRLEVIKLDEKTVLKINNQETATEFKLGSGKISLQPDGPIDLANIYVR